MAALKLFSLRNALRSTVAPQVRPLIRMNSLRRLSTESQTAQDASDDPFLRTPEEGLIYAKVTGIGWNTLKTDVINFFDESNLSTDDIKVEYTKAYNPVGMALSTEGTKKAKKARVLRKGERRKELLQFSSQSAFDLALKQNSRKGRLFKIEKVDRSHWDLTISYDGKAVMLEGLPLNSTIEDIERFLSGCNFDPSRFQTSVRPGFPDPVKLAIVHFMSRIDATNAFCWKNRNFCQNNPVSVRVLQ
ncbi:hypothetical protein ZIOFF_020453 [Zingiber officinale]|uniref:Uncharacterized protein n=1 Tax=Zingiber officinale TaxID=94328 RepID=A0A8J5GZ45_ZINOF|nr:hypothetical protein ZIOFF_020453 [Zingiber officinale]